MTTLMSAGGRVFAMGWLVEHINRLNKGVGAMNNVHFSSATDLWSTPHWLFDRLHAEFEFDLDVCALPENAKCDRFISPQQDGLISSWRLERDVRSVAWMNPPYGRSIDRWVAQAWRAANWYMDCELVVCLLPARTDTRWWWQYCTKGEIRFLPGRLKFGGSKNSAPFPSAVVIFESGRARAASVQWWDVRG